MCIYICQAPYEILDIHFILHITTQQVQQYLNASWDHFPSPALWNIRCTFDMTYYHSTETTIFVSISSSFSILHIIDATLNIIEFYCRIFISHRAQQYPKASRDHFPSSPLLNIRCTLHITYYHLIMWAIVFESFAISFSHFSLVRY